MAKIESSLGAGFDNVGTLKFFTNNGGTYNYAILDQNGFLLLNAGASNASGRVQLATHATAAGGYGFRSGLSLYSIGAGEIRATGDFTTDGRMGANNYGTHALASHYVGDNGYGSYVDSVGLIQYFRNLNNGKIYFRNSGNTENNLEVENGFVNVPGHVKVAGNQVVGARDSGWSAMTGAADKATVYAVGTVTLAQLAGRVMALQSALRTHGLID